MILFIDRTEREAWAMAYAARLAKGDSHSAAAGAADRLVSTMRERYRPGSPEWNEAQHERCPEASQ